MSTIDDMFKTPPPAPADDEPPGDVPRDGHKRPLIVQPDGSEPKAYVRASTMAGALDDKTALGDWKARMTGRGVALSPDLISAFASLTDIETPENKKAAKEIMEQAQERAGATRKRTMGTAFHGFTERFDKGERGFHVPDELRAVLTDYVNKTAGVRWLAIEAFGVVDELETAGTTDRIGQHPSMAKPRVWDVKTGRVDYGQLKFAVQLAIYARMKRYNPATGQRAPWPSIDLEVGHIIHADPETGVVQIYDVDLVKGWRAAQLAREVYDLRKDKGIMTMNTGFPAVQAEAPSEAAPTTLISDRKTLTIQRVQGNAHDEAAKLNGTKTIMQRMSACRTLDELKALHAETGHMWNTRHKAFAGVMHNDITEGKTS